MFFRSDGDVAALAAPPGCIRYEISKCLGPCVGGCSAAQYDERVGLAKAFLEGADDGPINMLREQMERLSAELEFERAAHYRDKLERLEALRAQFGRLRFAVENLSFVYTVPGHEGEDKVYLIRRGVVRAEVIAAVLEGSTHDEAVGGDIFAGRQADGAGADSRDRRAALFSPGPQIPGDEKDEAGQLTASSISRSGDFAVVAKTPYSITAPSATSARNGCTPRGWTTTTVNGGAGGSSMTTLCTSGVNDAGQEMSFLPSAVLVPTAASTMSEFTTVWPM